MDDRPAIDPLVLAKLACLADDDPGFVEDLIQGFLGSIPSQLTRLHEALDEEDLPRVAFTAHRLKSGAANLGAQPMADVLGCVEQLAESGRASELRELIAWAESEAERLIEWVAEREATTPRAA